ncbi:MAG: ribonuclease HI, partial [Chloroflexota bacterium]
MATDDTADSVTIYTDGGCDPNPGPGGWGAVLVAGPHATEISGAAPRTTNNRMELTAAIEALKRLRRRCDVVVYTDSTYLRNGITAWLAGWQARGWRKANGEPVENADLWQALAEEAARHQVQWHWLRGHRGHQHNERADRLATEARERLRRVGAPRVAPRAATPSEAPLTVPQVELYAEGCALGAPGPGGYAAVLVPASGEPRT